MFSNHSSPTISSRYLCWLVRHLAERKRCNPKTKQIALVITWESLSGKQPMCNDPKL